MVQHRIRRKKLWKVFLQHISHFLCLLRLKEKSTKKTIFSQESKIHIFSHEANTFSTRPSALGMSDPVMESLEILGAPEFSSLWRVEGDEGEIDEKVVKKDENYEQLWKSDEKRWKRWKNMQDNKKLWKKIKNYEKAIKPIKNGEKRWKSDEKWWKSDEKWWKTMKKYARQ